MTSYKIIISGDRAAVETPYNPDFVAAIKRIGGARWDSASKRWTVPAETVESVRAAMREAYGRDDSEPSDLLTVRIKTAKTLYKCCAPVVIYGKTVATATGRDSGARVGDDVAIITGGVSSGGSAKNWLSKVEEGSEIILYHVPAALVVERDGVEIISTTPEGINRAALEAEKARLLERIAEIDKQLND